MAIDLNKVADELRDEGRRKGYAEGYEACLKDMAAFLDTRNLTVITRDQNRETVSGRAPRGQAKKMVMDALRNLDGAPKSVKLIQETIDLIDGVTVPYSSIQNALFQLDRDGAVEMVGRGIWRLKTNTPPTEQTEGGVS